MLKPETPIPANKTGAALGPVQAAAATASPDLEKRIVLQVLEAIWIPKDATPEERDTRIKAALALLDGISPQDEIERMLAAQMIATHHAATDCLRRAMIPEQSLAARDMNLKHAAKLLAIYVRQLEVLDKHRGKGQQQMVVKYVNIESGAQAVVGNVQSESRAKRQESRGQRFAAGHENRDLGKQGESIVRRIRRPAKRRRPKVQRAR